MHRRTTCLVRCGSAMVYQWFGFWVADPKYAKSKFQMKSNAQEDHMCGEDWQVWG